MTDESRRNGAANQSLAELLIDRLEKAWPEVVAQDDVISNICSNFIPAQPTGGVTSPDYVMVPREPTKEMIRAAVPMYAAMIEDSEWPFTVNLYRAMLSAAPPSPRSDEGSGLTPHSTAVSAIAQERDVDLERIKEVLADGFGFWRTCSGCHETSDGYDVGHYPHSSVFNCKVGGGCSDCGGIGVIWDNIDYSDFGKELEAPTTSPKAISEEPCSEGRMRESLMQARASFQAIQRATIEGRVCDDVAWFSDITTLHDYCASEIEIIDKSIARCTALSPALRAQESAVALHAALSALLHHYRWLADRSDSGRQSGPDPAIVAAERALFDHRPLADWEPRGLSAAEAPTSAAAVTTPTPSEDIT